MTRPYRSFASTSSTVISNVSSESSRSTTDVLHHLTLPAVLASDRIAAWDVPDDPIREEVADRNVIVSLASLVLVTEQSLDGMHRTCSAGTWSAGRRHSCLTPTDEVRTHRREREQDDERRDEQQAGRYQREREHHRPADRRAQRESGSAGRSMPRISNSAPRTPSAERAKSKTDRVSTAELNMRAPSTRIRLAATRPSHILAVINALTPRVSGARTKGVTASPRRPRTRSSPRRRRPVPSP